MTTETKVGDIILQEQSTYYVYANEEEKKKGIWLLSSSNLKDAAEFQQALYENSIIKGNDIT